MFKTFLATLILSVSMVCTLSAQSSADMALAKQLAMQKGYSEAEIDAMIGGAGKNKLGSDKDNKTSIGSVDRSSFADSIQIRKNIDILDKLTVKKDTSDIYGRDIFKNENLTFIPNYNMPTPENYKLSAGDEVVIDVWGDVITNITTKISPEGSINIPNLGPVYLSGKTVKDAEESLKQYLSKIYSGISGEYPTTFAKLSLGNIRSVSVNVVGDVTAPGTYTLPSLTNMATALYLAGGPSGIGTIRDIALYRNGELISTFDAYEFITKGILSENVRLEDNDVITVKPYYGIVALGGGAKRPMKYEVKESDNLNDILTYAGGFTSDAYDSNVVITRKSASGKEGGATVKTIIIDKDNFNTFKLLDGDSIGIKIHEPVSANEVAITGAVWLPGSYALSLNDESNSGSSVSTLKELIIKAGGLKNDAYLERGYIKRLTEDRTKAQVSFSPMDIVLKGKDIELMANDSVFIYVKDSLTTIKNVEILGEVNAPGEYQYREGLTLGDVILMAKGATEAATLTNVEIARRIKVDNESGEDLSKQDTVAVIYYYNLLKDITAANSKLEPNDMIFIRKSVTYQAQESVSVAGEVNYPGDYVIEKNVVRLSDVIKKSGGFNIDAYVPGAKLTRKLTKVERERVEMARKIAKSQAEDTLTIDLMEIDSLYSVAIDLEAAVANPGSYADVVLREGDVLDVPKLNNTVKISGAVLYPNTISYKEGMRWKKYLSNAGGATKMSVKRKAYMVHMNGSVATKGDSNFKVMPGTEIIIPAKEVNANSMQNITAIMGIASSITSMGTMVMYFLNSTK